MSKVLYNPENGGNIGITDANGTGQLVLSDRKAYVHKVGETITYADNLAEQMLRLYPFLVDVDTGKKKPDYEEIKLDGKSFYLDPITKKVTSKEEVEKETVKEVVGLSKAKEKAIPSMPKEAVKIKVDKVAISRNNTANALKNFKDYGKSDFDFKDEGLTAD